MKHETGTGRAPYRRRRHPFLRGMFLIALLAAGLPHVIPTAVNRFVAPWLLTRYAVDLQLRRLDYTGLDAALSLGTRRSPWFEADTIRADFTPATLLDRRLSLVTVNGATVYMQRTDDGWQPRDAPPPFAHQRRARQVTLPGFLIDAVTLRSAQLVLEEQNRRRTVACGVTARQVRLDQRSADARLQLTAQFQGIVLNTDLILKKRGQRVQITVLPDSEEPAPLLTGMLSDMPVDLGVKDWRVQILTDADSGLLECSGRVYGTVTYAPLGSNPCRADVGTSLELAGTRDSSSGLLATRFGGMTTPQIATGPGFFHLPLTWPIPETGLKAQLELDSAALGDFKAGPLRVDLAGNAHGLSVTGECALGSGPVAVAIVSGTMPWEPVHSRPAGDWRVSLPLGNAASPLNLKSLLPGLPKCDVTGTVIARLSPHASSNATLTLQANVTTLDLEKPALLLEALNTCCRFHTRRLPASLPNQVMTIDRAMLGSLLWEEIEALYRIESDRGLTIQDAHATWCGGTIDLQGVTLRPGAKTLDLLVHADRIQVSQLFRQFNLPGASGDSSLSGRIPARWQRGRLRFRNGFLTTRPGRPGVISFGDTDAIAGALAQGAEQDSRLALVGAALKEFSYEWITLTLDSEDDQLAMQMSLFGKPTKKIPYRYENKTGGYVVTSRKEEWSSPEMQVDLNFHIPLDDIMAVTVQTTKRFKQNP